MRYMKRSNFNPQTQTMRVIVKARAEPNPLTASPYPDCLSLAEFSAAVAKAETKRNKARAPLLTSGQVQ